MQVGALRHGAQNVFMQGGVLGRVPMRRSFPLRFLFSNLLSAGLVDVPSLLFRKLLISTGVSGCPVRIMASDISAFSCGMGAVHPVYYAAPKSSAAKYYVVKV